MRSGHRSNYRPLKAVFLGSLMILQVVSAAPLDLRRRDAIESHKYNGDEIIVNLEGTLKRRQDGGFNPPEYIPGTMIPTSAEEIPTPTTEEPEVPSTTEVSEEPSTTVEEMPTTTTSEESESTTSSTLPSTTSEFVLPSTTSTEDQYTTQSIETTSEVLPTSTSNVESTTSTTELDSRSTTSEITTSTSTTEISTSSSSSTSTSLPETSLPSYETDTSSLTTALPTTIDITTTSEATTSPAESSTSITEPTTSTIESTTSAIESTTTTSELRSESSTTTTETEPTSSVSTLSTTSEETSTAAETTTSSNGFDEPGFSTIAPPSNGTLPTAVPTTTSTTSEDFTTSETSAVSTDIESTSTSTEPAYLLPTGTPSFGDGFSYINPPNTQFTTSTSVADVTTTSSEAGSTSTSTSSEVDSTTTSTSSEAESTTTSTSSELEFTTTSSSDFVTSTSDVETTSTSVEEITTTSTEISTSSSSGILTSSTELTSSETTSTRSEEETSAVESTQPTNTVPGAPDLIIPTSSAPDSYIPAPTDGGDNVVAPEPTSEVMPSTTEESVQPTEVASSETFVPTGGVGAPPDLVIPTTTVQAFPTDNLGGGADEVEPTPSDTTSSTSTSTEYEYVTFTETSSVLDIPSTNLEPTTVYITIAPTATITETAPASTVTETEEADTVTETLYPTLSTDVPVTSVSAIPSGDYSAPDLDLPTSLTESYSPEPTDPTGEGNGDNVAFPTSLESSTSMVESTLTVTATREIVYTSYSTIIATLPETLPIPTASDDITTVFETQTAGAAPSEFPDFGNIVYISSSISGPPLLMPPIETLEPSPVTSPAPYTSELQGETLPTAMSQSDPFSYIATTIQYPSHSAVPVLEPTTSSSEKPLQTGYLIGEPIINMQNKPASEAVSKLENRSTPTTLSTMRTSVDDVPMYTPTAIGESDDITTAPILGFDAENDASRSGGLKVWSAMVIAAFVGFLISA